MNREALREALIVGPGRSLARASLVFHWRRSWILISLLALAGMALYIQLGTSYAYLSEATAFERGATADVIVIANGKGGALPFLADDVLPRVAQSALLEKVEVVAQPFLPVLTVGRKNRLRLRIVDPVGLSAPRVLDETARALLQRPGAVLLTEADAARTGLRLGEEISADGVGLRVVGVFRGGLGEDGSLVSAGTAELVRRARPRGATVPPSAILAAPDSVSASALVSDLNRRLMGTGARAYEREAFIHEMQNRIVSGNRMARSFLIAAAVCCVALTVIAMQATSAAIEAQRVELSILFAIGVHWSFVARTVLEQSLWIGAFGAAFASSLGVAAGVVLRRMDVAIEIVPATIVAVTTVLMLSALAGGVIALPQALKIKPIDLLR